MSAAEALKAARAAGVELGIDGDDLVLEASAPPPAAVLDLLSRHKAEIVALLRPGRRRLVGRGLAGLLRRAGRHRRVRWRTAACGGRGPGLRLLRRRMAEPQSGERSPAGRCLGCGGRDHAHDPLLPYGVEPTGHAWLHSRCWPAWYEARKAKAAVGTGGNGDHGAGHSPDGAEEAHRAAAI